jgi:hypothetical protein
LRDVRNRSFRSGWAGHKSHTSHTAQREYSNQHLSDQLWRAGDDLPEYLCFDRRRADDNNNPGGATCGAIECRRL